MVQARKKLDKNGSISDQYVDFNSIAKNITGQIVDVTALGIPLEIDENGNEWPEIGNRPNTASSVGIPCCSGAGCPQLVKIKASK